MTTVATRGTTNTNVRGNAEDRRRRREWLVETYRANVTGIKVTYASQPMPLPDLRPSPRVVSHRGNRALSLLYRCGKPLTVDTVTVDRIIPGCLGGTYRRNNIRPACGACSSETGGALAARSRR